MGGSGRWIKSLISLKKPPQSSTDQEKAGGKGRKWKLWRSGSGGFGVGNPTKEGKGSDLVAPSRSSSGGEYAFSAAVATVVRAPPKDFKAIRQEWAAIRIQAAFRAFLARQALRALKAVVRLQAIFRGRKVRKQAAITLQCMQALVRVQAKIRASSFQTTQDQQPPLQIDVQDKPNNLSDPIKMAEGGWCSSPGTVAEVKAKLKMRQKGAIQRERANIYALTQQANPTSLSWLERWVASKPWESRLMEEMNTDATPSPRFRKSDSCTVGSRSSFSEIESVKVKRNNVSTRVSARPIPMSAQFSRSCSDPWHEESTTTSSPSNSESTGSPVVGKTPSYMNPTKSIKAKQRESPYSSRNVQKQVKDNVRYLRKTMQQYSSEESRSYGESDLYPPANLDRFEWVKTERG